MDGNTLIVDGLTSPVGTITAGGYKRVGSLVVVNLRLNLTETLAANQTVIAGLPRPKGVNQGLNYISATSVVASNAFYISAAGVLCNQGPMTSTGTLILSAVYVAN